MLYPSMMFRVANVDAAKAGEAWRMIPDLMHEAEARGVNFPRKGAIVRPQKNTSEWRVNVTQMKHPDGTRHRRYRRGRTRHGRNLWPLAGPCIL